MSALMPTRNPGQRMENHAATSFDASMAARGYYARSSVPLNFVAGWRHKKTAAAVQSAQQRPFLAWPGGQ